MENLVLWEVGGQKHHPVELKVVVYQVALALNLQRKELVEVFWELDAGLTHWVVALVKPQE